ncbi:nitrogen fixation protein NifH [Chloroflexota bacterium]
MSVPLDWLLEEDVSHPGARYFGLIELLDCPAHDPAVVDARRLVMESGPVPSILAAQDEGGFWEKPGTGYYPKYRGTVWSIIYLALLGADRSDPRIQAGGDYLLHNARTKTGAFSLTGTPAGNIHCLAGNLGAALLDLGFLDDPRLMDALELMAHYVTGDRLPSSDGAEAEIHYLKSGTCGPGFRCSANNGQPCAWGAVKVLRALARVPEGRRSPIMAAALQVTTEFLFSVDPSTGGYPAGYSDKPSRSWFRFGFPVFYVTDILQTAEALSDAGLGADPRLSATHDLLLGKRDEQGRWRMEYSYHGKTWADPEPKNKASKWVTLRALRVLKAGGRLDGI